MRRLSFLIWLGIISPNFSWGAQCAVDPLDQYTQLGGNHEDNKIHVVSDTSIGDYFRSDFSGSVKVNQGDKHLFAPKITYIRDENAFTATDGITVGMPTMAAKGETGTYYIELDRFNFSQAQYYLVNDGIAANGFAESGSVNRKTKIDKFQNVSYTTCSRTDPGWNLKSKSLTLNHNTNRGVAKNATFNIANTPVFWLPYFSFPLNGQRATGFLAPTISNSTSRGFEIEVPFYWNIAENQDATLTLHPMTSRGVMFESAYRFITENQKGSISGAWIDDTKYNDQRWQVALDHQYQINNNWYTKVSYQDVSDIDYQDDLDGDLSLYNSWYLNRYAALYGTGKWGNLMLRTQDYKRVSSDVPESATPYSRTQITYDKSIDVKDFTFGVSAEAVRFDKYDYGSANRYNANLSANYRLSNSYGFIEPKINYDLTHYDLYPEYNSDSWAFTSGSINRVVPTISLDSGLYFERDFTVGSSSYTQTLEPRIYYLYTPYRNQTDIPTFDTSESSQSWSWLFSDNRFTGKDRIGDANQLTTALTSRFYRKSDGQEKLKVSVGQIQYFQDRRVGLYDDVNIDDSKSVFVTEGQYKITDGLEVSGLSFWDPNKHQNKKSSLNVKYQFNADRYINAGHFYDREYYDQIYIGSGWRINESWRAFARYDYSLRYNRAINIMAGLEYSDCCWAIRVVGKNYRDNPDDEGSDNAIYLEFVFKGLSNIGNSTSSILTEQLPQFSALPQEKSL